VGATLGTAWGGAVAGDRRLAPEGAREAAAAAAPTSPSSRSAGSAWRSWRRLGYRAKWPSTSILSASPPAA